VEGSSTAPRLPTTAASELIAILYDEGIPCLFLNPGMQVPALRSALAEARSAGVPHPQPVLCAHEQVALFAAHGHQLASRAPQAVMVHIERGELDFDRALLSAQRDRIPITVLCGPEEVASGRSRRFKWEAGITEGRRLGTFLRRAIQITRSEPTGLARLTLPREALAQPAGTPSRRLLPPRPPAADLSALEEMAQLLASAEFPVIVAGQVGRSPSAAASLAQLAETLAAPVVDFRQHVNLPPNHPLGAGLEPLEYFNRADAVLLLDVDTPCLPGLDGFPVQAWVLQIDADCLKADQLRWSCPVEIAITADTAQALPHLVHLLADRLAGRTHVDARRERLQQALAVARAAWRARAEVGGSEDPVDGYVAELNRALPEDTMVFEEVPSLGEVALRQMERPIGHFFRRTGASGGWALGAALGARIASASQPVVALCDQVAFEQGLPTAVLWSAHRAGAPFLAVVLARGGPVVRRRSGSRTRSSGTESELLTLARAAGGEGEVIDHPVQVAGAVERLLALTRDGLCTVLEARLPMT
jgi:acetolactate synthase-1/2/3 large subunit